MAALPDLSALITPRQVKIQLGVDDTDIADDKIKDSGAYEELMLDFYDWFPKFMDLINDATGTPEVQMQQIAVKSYGKFFVCWKVALSGRLSFYQKIGDGENADTRFKIDWDALIDDFLGQMATLKAKALAIDTPMSPAVKEVASFSSFGVVTPGLDNVRQ